MSNLSQEPTTVKNPLINKKIFIYPVIREGGWLNDIHKHHDGAFLFTGAKIIIQGVPFDQSTGRLAQTNAGPSRPGIRSWRACSCGG